MALKILLVDDDEDQLLLRGMLLRQSGFDTCQADSARAAQQCAASYRPDCAVVDLHLPTEAAGLDLIRKLKAADPAIYLVVLTGAATKTIAASSIEGLVDEVMVKGSSARRLVERLKTVPLRRASEFG